MSAVPTPAECPVCGAAVPRGARACPACGADERSGWSEDETRYDGLDLPASAFEDESISPSANKKAGRRVNGLPLVWWCVALGLLILALYGLVAR